MRWILRLSGKEAFLPYKRLWCALNPTGTLAAFVAVQLVPPRWVLHVVNTTNGAGAALQLPHQPTGIAFRGQQILVSVRRNRPRFDECLAVALSSEAGGEHLAATKRFAVPGKLVGVAGIYPVFESQFGNELFMHGRYLQLQREKILRVLCSHGKVVVVTDSGAVWLWGRGKARRLFRAGEPVIGSGQWKGDFWLVESSGRADLISPTGQVQHAQLRLPAPR